MNQLQLNETELVEAQTHIKLVQKAYKKVESAQYAAKELEGDFKEYITNCISMKGGDPDLQYQFDTDTGSLELIEIPISNNEGTDTKIEVEEEVNE